MEPRQIGKTLSTQLRSDIPQAERQKEVNDIQERLAALEAHIHSEIVAIRLAMAAGTTGALAEFPAKVVKAVSAQTSVPESSIMGKSKRGKRTLYARNMARFIIRRYSEASYPEIAEMFAAPDHTGIMYSERKFAKWAGIVPWDGKKPNPYLEQAPKDLAAVLEALGSPNPIR